MKAPPKRKGNARRLKTEEREYRLNESPSQKEGKSPKIQAPNTQVSWASMKALPRRKGNPRHL